MADRSRSLSAKEKRTSRPTFEPNDGQIPAYQLFNDPLLRYICLVGGSRSGKTFFIVRAIMLRALKSAGSRHVILRSKANAAKQSISMITLPAVNQLCFPDHSFHWHQGDNYWLGPNGSEIWVGGLDDKERVEKILGKEYISIFLNECSQISYSSVLLVRTRLAQVMPDLAQRMYCDLNPVGKLHWTNVVFGSKKDPISGQPLPHPEQYARLFLNPEQNRKNLAPEYLADLRDETNVRHRKRFYEGVYVDEVEDALWQYAEIEAVRIIGLGPNGNSDPERKGEDEPGYTLTVIAVDPSGASTPSKEFDGDTKPKNDETGIVVASRGEDGYAYLRADLSTSGGPEQWGHAAIAAYHAFKADYILVEVNFGGGMVASVIRSIDPNVAIKEVRASQGKHIRAQPVSTFYKEIDGKRVGGVHHVGRFPLLEDQLCAFTSLGYGGPKSPDRADAWIWAVNDLLIQTNGAEGWIEYYRRLNEKAGVTHSPEFGFQISSQATKICRVQVPPGISHVYLSDGTQMLVPADRIITVPEVDAKALGRRGWQRLPDEDKAK